MMGILETSWERPWEFEENMGNALRTHLNKLKIRWEHIGNIKIWFFFNFASAKH
jgi:hypothetical protein